MADKARNINYLNREFNDFRNSLVEYSKAYFPNTYNDFTDTSTGMLFMEMASYVGDVLSFYLDNQIQETFIQYARQTENIYNLAYFLGYKPKVTTAASVEIDFYQQLPAKLDGGVTVPDYSYCLRIPENTPVTANYDASIKFLTQDVVDFSHSSSLDPTEISVYELSGTQPTYYLLKKTHTNQRRAALVHLWLNHTLNGEKRDAAHPSTSLASLRVNRPIGGASSPTIGRTI